MTRRYVDATRFLSSLDRTKTEVSQEVEEMTQEMADLGAERTRYYIRTRGTNKTWGQESEGTRGKPSGWWSKKTGRYRYGSFSSRFDSGDMLRAVGTQIAAGPRQSRAVFGWVRNVEDYFRYQEEGFFNVKARLRVDGMFALRDARKDVVAETPKIARKYERRIARRLNR
jgi:hypothetical protein